MPNELKRHTSPLYHFIRKTASDTLFTCESSKGPKLKRGRQRLGNYFNPILVKIGLLIPKLS